MNDYFEQNKKLILQLANTEAGRFLLGLKDKDRIIKISPNSVHQLKDFQNGKSIIQAKFWACDNVAQIFLPTLAKVEIAQDYQPIKDKYEAFLHFSGLEKRLEYPQIYLETANFYSTSEDGKTRHSTISGDWETWDDARGVQGDEGVDKTTGDDGMEAHFEYIAGSGYGLVRGWARFNYTSLPQSAVINSATYKFYGRAYGTTADQGIVIAQGNQGPTLEASDHASYGAEWGRFTTPAGSDQWNSASLNSTGKSAINKGGYTEYAYLNARDFDNQPVSSNGHWGMLWDASEVGSTQHYMEITYTLAGGIFLHNYL